MSATEPTSPPLDKRVNRSLSLALQRISIEDLKKITENPEFKRVDEEMLHPSDKTEDVIAWAGRLSKIPDFEKLDLNLRGVKKQAGLKEAMDLIKNEYIKKIQARMDEMNAKEIKEAFNWTNTKGVDLLAGNKLDDYVKETRAQYDKIFSTSNRKDEFIELQLTHLKKYIDKYSPISPQSLTELNSFLNHMKTNSPELSTSISEFQTLAGTKTQQAQPATPAAAGTASGEQAGVAATQRLPDSSAAQLSALQVASQAARQALSPSSATSSGAGALFTPTREAITQPQLQTTKVKIDEIAYFLDKVYPTNSSIPQGFYSVKVENDTGKMSYFNRDTPKSYHADICSVKQGDNGNEYKLSPGGDDKERIEKIELMMLAVNTIHGRMDCPNAGSPKQAKLMQDLAKKNGYEINFLEAQYKDLSVAKPSAAQAPTADNENRTGTAPRQ